MRLKKNILSTFLFIISLILTGCTLLKNPFSRNNTTSSGGSAEQTGNKKIVTDRTDYTIFYNQSNPSTLGGISISQYILGHPIPEAETIKYNAYLVPWRIDFSQVQHTGISAFQSACTNLQEQVIYIDGWIDLDLSSIGVSPSDLPREMPVSGIKGTVHETVKGTPGSWKCMSDTVTNSVNAGSVQYVQQVSGTHTANFADASNMGNMTIDSADIYLDLSMPENIQMIWPAGTKIERPKQGTPIPLEPLPSSDLLKK